MPAAAVGSGSIVACQALRKVFNDFWMRPRVTAVDGLDFSVHKGEVFGLLGPNGSGKSTTIKMILGLLYPTSGRISLMGKPPTDVAIKSRLGYLPEETHLYRFLDARETLDYYARLFRLDSQTRLKRMDMLLEMVGLAGLEGRPIGEYSKGMQRRIGLAQALINDPDFLILDEPTSGLDPIGTRQIKDLILHLKQRGKTILLSSHLLADVEDVCDRVVILYGGKIRSSGTIEELLTVSNSMLIETETLQPATVEKLKEIILALEHKEVRGIAAPRRKLETLFLEIVERAQTEGALTSGARSGGAIAGFLSGNEPVSSDGKNLIESLIQPKPQAETKTAQLSKAEAGEKATKADASLIGELTRLPQNLEPVPHQRQISEEAAAAVDRAAIDALLAPKIEKTHSNDHTKKI